MKTRQQLINDGKMWQVYPNGDIDNVLFEGTKGRCMDYITINCKGDYKKGLIRLGKVVFEPQNQNNGNEKTT